MATRPNPKLSYEDYARFPDDGRRRQLIDGEVYVVPAPSTRHQRIVGRLYRLMADHVETSGGGEVFVAPTDVVTEPNIKGPPTLVVEVYRLGAEGYGRPEILEPGDTLATPLIPGLAIDVGGIFRRQSPR